MKHYNRQLVLSLNRSLNKLGALQTNNTMIVEFPFNQKSEDDSRTRVFIKSSQGDSNVQPALRPTDSIYALRKSIYRTSVDSFYQMSGYPSLLPT